MITCSQCNYYNKYSGCHGNAMVCPIEIAHDEIEASKARARYSANLVSSSEPNFRTPFRSSSTYWETL